MAPCRKDSWLATDIAVVELVAEKGVVRTNYCLDPQPVDFEPVAWP